MTKIKKEMRFLMGELAGVKNGNIKANKYEEDAVYTDLCALEDEYPKVFKEAIKENIKELRKEIIEHDELYDKGNPVITDSEYDKLYFELVDLESKYPEFHDSSSPTQKIITTVVDNLKKVKHTEPMLSQQKINTRGEVIQFIGENNGNILVQEKLDGITLVLKYTNGELTEAISRGDGETGEDLYHNIVHFDNVPKHINFKGQLEIRTEAVLPFEDFNKMNINNDYSNPRNLVSGSLRQLDSSNVIGKGFKAIAFDLITAEGESFKSDSERLSLMRNLGFEVVNTTLFEKGRDPEDIFDYINNYEYSTREKLEHMIDGMVIKYDDLGLRKTLGYTSKHPRWATAYKFKSLDATTKLISITEQVGKTGQITPVAELETVNIAGVNISRATLHNYNNIKNKDIRIGDTVLVARANDVIPQIIKPIKDIRKGNEVIVSTPKICPVCNSITEIIGANVFCMGLNCTPQLEGKIKHFASRDAMNIDGFGNKTIETFFNEGITKSILDIYNIKNKKDEILKLEGFGERKFERIVEGIKKSKNRELRNFIYGLSIKNVGRSASRDLANSFKSMEHILEISKDKERFKEELLKVGLFGEVMSNHLVNFLKEEKNRERIMEFMKLGINMEIKEEKEEKIKQILDGKVFVVTGKVVMFKNRKQLQERIEILGGKITGSVSKNTDYLINNDKESKSSKNKRAKEINVPIINEDEFFKLLTK